MEFKLKAEKREKNEKLGVDFIPVVLYGKGIENQSLKIKLADFNKIFLAAGESNLISLDYGTGIVRVLVKDTQRDPLKNSFIHADLYQVNMKEKVVAEIPLHFVGESKLIREQGGMLMKDMDNLEIECLPDDLVDHIDVDISVIAEFGDGIRINDLKLPKGIELVSENNEMVANISEPKAIVEEAPVAAPAAPAAGTPAEGGKKEEKKEEKK